MIRGLEIETISVLSEIIFYNILGCLILTWYFYETSPVITKRLSLLKSSILQTFSVKIWAKSIHWFTSCSVWKQPTSEFFAKLETSEFRVLMKHYFLGGKTLSESTNTETTPSPGRPNEITTPKMINKIHDIVLNDPKVKVCEIASMSTERVVNILHTNFCMRKLSARRVPRLLTIDQKGIRVTASMQNLAYFYRNPKEFLRWFVTMNETWIHHYTRKSREESKQWVKPGESAPKRPKTQESPGKVMVNVFWDAHGVIFIDYLEEGRTITGAYYVELLDRLIDEIRNKRPHLKKRKILFHGDNAHIEDCRNQIAWIEIRIASACYAFSRPGPQWLLSVPKPQERVVW